MPYYPERKPEPSGVKQKKEKPYQNRFLRLAVTIVSCTLVLYGSVRLIMYYADLNASRNTSRELQQISKEETDSPSAKPEQTAVTVPLPAAAPEKKKTEEALPATEEGILLHPVKYPDNPELKVSERFLKLRKKSGYIVGWLSFDEVNEPVVQKDNSYFLKWDATGKKNSNGAIFLDSGISLLTRPYTIILYGHNMKSGNMFGRLKKYKDSSYFYTNRIITFDSLYEEGQYAAFAVVEFETVPGVARWYNLWSLATDNRAAREKAIRELERKSVINSVLDVQEDDQILLLVTCLDGDTERLMVAARRLRDNEKPGNLTVRKNQ